MTAIPELHWPTKDEYDLAIMQWQQTIGDADIQRGTLACDEMGIHRYGGANLYVCVYKIGDWMVRCFCTNPPYMTPPDILERYIAISKFCELYARRIPALLPVKYIEKGITVGKRVLPLVKMPFLTGVPPLGEFIADNYQNQALMVQLSKAWFQMIRELEAIPMAHGDLDLTNVLVEQEGFHLRLKLIDYDNVWIPKLAHLDQTEYGHEAFQHPHFFNTRTRPYTARMDRFSALIIYISLKMLAQRPELYAEWGADESEQLLLTSTDYQNAALATSHIAQLSKLCRPDLRPYIDELNACLYEKRMPHSLEQIATTSYRSSNLKPTTHDKYNHTEASLSTHSLSIALWDQKILNGANAHLVTPATILTNFYISPGENEIVTSSVIQPEENEIVTSSVIQPEENEITMSSSIPIAFLTKKRKIAPLTLAAYILLAFFLILVVVAVVLFYTHVISLASSRGGPSLAISQTIRVTLYSHAYVQGDIYVVV